MAQGFYVHIVDPDGFDVSVPDSLNIQPQRFNAIAKGGSDSADLQVSGPKEMLFQMLLWLGHDITIRNPEANSVWWGIIEEVTITLGGITAGLTLKEMVNRVQVVYTAPGADGAPVQRTTDWAEDTDSSDKYGTREARVTLADASDEQADAKRDSLLEALSKPLPIITSDQSTSVYATIHCIGKWHTLGYKYYADTSGRDEFTASGADQVLGVGFTSTQVGFNGVKGWIFGMGGGGFLVDSKFKVSGSGSNNGTFTVRSQHEQTDEDYTASTISFVAVDDINDSANGFGNFQDGDAIQVIGSTSNDGIYTLGDAEAATIEVSEGNLVNESAGASVTVQRKNYVRTVEGIVEEDAGASVTVTAYGVQIAQKFTPATDSYTVDSLSIRIKRVGSPGDNVKVALHADSGGNPGAELDSGTVTGTDIPTATDWVEFTLNNTDTINFGTDYWIVVSRTGSNSATAYYVVDVDEDLGYTLGNLKLYDGSSWVARPVNADMPFRVLGALETTDQMSNIVAENDFLTGIDVVDTSGIESNQYRDGEFTAGDEVERLLDSGTSSGKRLIALVSVEGYLRVREQPGTDDLTYGENQLFWDSNGQLRDASGRAIPLGYLPVGYWITLSEIPAAVGHLAALSPFFCEAAEYDVADQRWFLETEGVASIWRQAETEIG